jgi:hypothetical protein
MYVWPLSLPKLCPARVSSYADAGGGRLHARFGPGVRPPRQAHVPLLAYSPANSTLLAARFDQMVPTKGRGVQESEVGSSRAVAAE